MEPRKIASLTATYRNDRRVIINEVDFPLAEIRALQFDNAVDDAVWYHGFWTNIENLTDIHIHYADGSMVIAGDPLICNLKVEEVAP